jgi:hypothetical protein
LEFKKRTTGWLNEEVDEFVNKTTNLIDKHFGDDMSSPEGIVRRTDGSVKREISKFQKSLEAGASAKQMRLYRELHEDISPLGRLVEGGGGAKRGKRVRLSFPVAAELRVDMDDYMLPPLVRQSRDKGGCVFCLPARDRAIGNSIDLDSMSADWKEMIRDHAKTTKVKARKIIIQKTNEALLEVKTRRDNYARDLAQAIRRSIDASEAGGPERQNRIHELTERLDQARHIRVNQLAECEKAIDQLSSI